MKKQREKEIAMNSWYSCMIAMGSIPANEDLYFETLKRFKKKYEINKNEQVKTTCDEEFKDIKDKYLSLKIFIN